MFVNDSFSAKRNSITALCSECRYGMLFAKPLHLTVEEARLSEVKWSV
jgi:hypothetical protein